MSQRYHSDRIAAIEERIHAMASADPSKAAKASALESRIRVLQQRFEAQQRALPKGEVAADTELLRRCMQSYCAASIEMAFETPVTTRSQLRQTLSECGFNYTTTARATRPGTLGLMPFQWQSGTDQKGSHARGGSLLLASVAARYVEGALSGSDAAGSLPDVSTGYCPGAVSCLISLSCQARAAGAKAALVEKDAALRGSGFSRGAGSRPPGQPNAKPIAKTTGIPQQITESHHLALWAVAVALAGSTSFPFDPASHRSDFATTDADQAVPLPVRMPIPEAWLNLSAAAASIGLRDAAVAAAEHAQRYAAIQARAVFEAHPGLRDTALLLTDSSTELGTSDMAGRGSRPVGALAAAMRAETSTGVATGRLWWHHPCLCADEAWSSASFARKSLSAIFEVAAMASYNCGTQLEHMGRLEDANKAYQRGQTASALRLGLDHQLTKRLQAAAADVDRQLKPTMVADDDEDVAIGGMMDDDTAPPVSTVAPRHANRQSRNKGSPQTTGKSRQHGGPLAASITPRVSKASIRRPSQSRRQDRIAANPGMDVTAMNEAHLEAAYVPDARFQASPEPHEETNTLAASSPVYGDEVVEIEAEHATPNPEAMAAAMMHQPGSASRARHRDRSHKETGSKSRQGVESRQKLGAGLKAYLEPPALPSLPMGRKTGFGGGWRPKGPGKRSNRHGGAAVTKGQLYIGAAAVEVEMEGGSSSSRITTARQRQRQKQRHVPLTARDSAASNSNRALTSSSSRGHTARRPASAPRGSRGESDGHERGWLPSASSNRLSKGVVFGGTMSTARLTDSEMALAGPFVIAEPSMAVPSIGGDGLRPNSATRRVSVSTGRFSGHVRSGALEQLSPVQEQEYAYSVTHQVVASNDDKDDHVDDSSYRMSSMKPESHPKPPALPPSGLFYASKFTSEPHLSARRASSRLGSSGRVASAASGWRQRHESMPAYDGQQTASAVTHAVKRAEQRGTPVPQWARAIAEAEAAKEAEIQVFTTMQVAAADLRRSLGLSTVPHGSSRPDFAPHTRDTTFSRVHTDSYGPAPFGAVSKRQMTRAQAELDNMLGPDVTAANTVHVNDPYVEDILHATAPITPSRGQGFSEFVVSGQQQGIIEPVPLQTLSPTTPGAFMPAGSSQD